MQQPNSDQLPEITVVDTQLGQDFIDWREMWRYRDLLYFLVWRNIRTRYAQSVLGLGWAIIQPLFSMVVFTIVFGNLAKVDSDGVPYSIFSYTALVPWTYFANSLSGAGNSLTDSSSMLSKVYFPRLILPIAPVVSNLIDFFIALLILLGMMLWFRIVPTIGIIFLPFLILLMMLAATGIGLWLTTLSVQYRDVKYGLSFFIQLLFFASPVVYPASSVPPQLRLLYALNPMAGVIEGFRSAFLGTNPMPWDMIAVGTGSAVLITIGGALYFRHMERIFADVI